MICLCAAFTKVLSSMVIGADLDKVSSLANLHTAVRRYCSGSLLSYQKALILNPD